MGSQKGASLHLSSAIKRPRTDRGAAHATLSTALCRATVPRSRPHTVPAAASPPPPCPPPHLASVWCSGGLGQIDHNHLYKNDADIGMLVVKIGGPAYRIGMGGGAASSVPSGSNSADLDFNAVQVPSPPHSTGFS